MLDDKYLPELVKKAADFGGGKIHIIVNNAGFTWDGVIHKTTEKQWRTIVDLHGTAPFKLIQAAAPYFRVKDGEPRNIVNISSTSGTHGNAGQANYAFAKAGVTGLTRAIAKEWGPTFGTNPRILMSLPVANHSLRRSRQYSCFRQYRDQTNGCERAGKLHNAGRRNEGCTRYPPETRRSTPAIRLYGHSFEKKRDCDGSSQLHPCGCLPSVLLRLRADNVSYPHIDPGLRLIGNQ